jgi:hypothetical protein
VVSGCGRREIKGERGTARERETHTERDRERDTHTARRETETRETARQRDRETEAHQLDHHRQHVLGARAAVVLAAGVAEHAELGGRHAVAVLRGVAPAVNRPR